MRGERRDTGKIYHVGRWFKAHDARKVKWLRQLAQDYGADPQMRWFTAKIVENAGAQPRDYQAQAAAILAFVQNHVYYTNEPGEQIQSPWRTLSVKNGDCDDCATLMASMAESIALPWRFALGGKMRDGRPVRWIEGQPWPAGAQMGHIYVFLGWPPFAPSAWAAAEPTVRGLPLGHDVVTQGVPEGMRGGHDLGSGTSNRGVGGFGGFFGCDTGTCAAAPPVAQTATGLTVREETSSSSAANATLSRAWNAIGGRDLLPSVVQGTITALAIAWATRTLLPGEKR